MNQLSGHYVNVVLAVEEGRGMEFLKNNVHISANFNGRILESDRIPPQEYPPFNTELVWEIEKKDLRKIRSTNQPLRLECITVDSHNRKERIGFTLLSLRSAQIVPLKDAKNDPPFKWQKLIGCQTDKKNCHPELYLSLTIRDHLLPKPLEEVEAQVTPYVSEEETELSTEPFKSKFPIHYLEDGYIQIGEPTAANGFFCFNFLIKQTGNLDTLLPEVLVFNEQKEKFHLSFKIFRINIKTKPLNKDLHETFTLNERIVVKLLSSLNILREFFQEQNIDIHFYCENDKLGTTHITLKDVLENCEWDQKGGKVYRTATKRVFFKFPSPNGIVPVGSDDRSPFIDVEISVKVMQEYESPQKEFNIMPESLKVENSIEVLKKVEEKMSKAVFSSLSHRDDLSHDGEQERTGFCFDRIDKLDGKSESDPQINQRYGLRSTTSFANLINNVNMSPVPKPRMEECNVMDVYKKYILEVELVYFVWKKTLGCPRIVFKFLHPKAASYITVLTEIDSKLGEEVNLKDLCVMVAYISVDSQIKHLLNAWPPKIVLTDESEKLISEEVEFNTSLFSTKTANAFTYGTELKTVRTLEPLARICINLSLKEYNLYEAVDVEANLNLLPPVLDEMINVKEIIDIESWKIAQRDKFEAELQKIKEVELQKLKLDYDKNKKEMEEKLNDSIEKCRVLQEKLQKKVEKLKTENVLLKRRTGSDIYEGIFKENWKQYSNCPNHELIELLSKQQRDNELLKEIVEEQRQELQAFEKSALTKEQTANLLHELKGLEQKFDDAQRAKSYFKDQWKRACEEIHEMKVTDYKQLQNQIQLNREQLSQMSLDHFASEKGDSMPRLDLFPIDEFGKTSRSYM